MIPTAQNVSSPPCFWPPHAVAPPNVAALPVSTILPCTAVLPALPLSLRCYHHSQQPTTFPTAAALSHTAVLPSCLPHTSPTPVAVAISYSNHPPCAANLRHYPLLEPPTLLCLPLLVAVLPALLHVTATTISNSHHPLPVLSPLPLPSTHHYSFYATTIVLKLYLNCKWISCIAALLELLSFPHPLPPPRCHTPPRCCPPCTLLHSLLLALRAPLALRTPLSFQHHFHPCAVVLLALLSSLHRCPRR